MPVATAAVARPRLRARVGAVVVVACAAVLSACSGTYLPFSKSGAVTPGRASPPVAVRAITGLPEDKAAALVNALVTAAARRDIAIVHEGGEGGYYRLSGHFQLQPTASGTVVGYYWTVADAQGQLLHEIADNEPARPGGQEPWAGVDDEVIARIAAYTAERLSSRFSQLGFATSIAGLPPPVDHMVEAGPGAERDVDFETLYGTNALPAADPALGEADSSLPMQAGAAPVEAGPPPERDPAVSESADAIRAVAVVEVTGATGDGNGELSMALKRVLSGAGWPVEDRPGQGILAIHGNIDVGEPRGKAQKVALRWTVKAPGGQILGTVEQANEVPAGSLDKGWGKAADYAAQAAAEGIFDLVNRLR